jgi:hypothetical protein
VPGNGRACGSSGINEEALSPATVSRSRRESLFVGAAAAPPPKAYFARFTSTMEIALSSFTKSGCSSKNAYTVLRFSSTMRASALPGP